MPGAAPPPLHRHHHRHRPRAAAAQEAISRAAPAPAAPPQLRRPLAALPMGLSTHRPRPPTRSCIRPTALVAPRAARRPRAPHRCPGATALGRRCTSMLSRSKLLLPSCAGPTALAARHAASSALALRRRLSQVLRFTAPGRRNPAASHLAIALAILSPARGTVICGSSSGRSSSGRGSSGSSSRIRRDRMVSRAYGTSRPACLPRR
mmetsp:Transcript_61872/g.177466  ORF Transcript_61872/g.177466 Transcript_61872/m.177466 type:complete len:207 (-) Transcript_61872:110-730(-)